MSQVMFSSDVRSLWKRNSFNKHPGNSFHFPTLPLFPTKNQEAIDLHISACKRSRSKSLPCDDSEAEASDDDSLTKEEFEEFRKMIDAAAKVQEPPAATMKEKCPKCFQYECKCFST